MTGRDCRLAEGAETHHAIVAVTRIGLGQPPPFHIAADVDGGGACPGQDESIVTTRVQVVLLPA
ncbi:hypothetical protein DBT52_09465 [Aerococcus mictus]|nr:hypothetical protein DBT52_09465 [Aerococcus mictus]